MRTLRDIRSGAALVHRRSAGRALVLAMGPLSALLFLIWLGDHPPLAGRTLASLALGSLGLLFLLTATGRTFRVRPSSDSKLVWEEGFDSEDDYRVFLEAPGQRRLVLEHHDPARVLIDLKRLREELGLPVQGPSWLDQASPKLARTDTLSGREEGQYWPYQTRAAHAVLGAAAFILAVFGFSLRAEHELSGLSLTLPLATAALTALVGYFLLKLQVQVQISSERIRFAARLFGFERVQADLACADLRGARAVGHGSHPPQHLLLETSAGPRALRLSPELMTRVLGRLTPNSPSHPPYRDASKGQSEPHDEN